METELAINLEHDRITYLYRTMVLSLLFGLVASGRETWGPFRQLGLCNAGLGLCCVRAQLLRPRNV
jgi:hypothetical protein